MKQLVLLANLVGKDLDIWQYMESLLVVGQLGVVCEENQHGLGKKKVKKQELLRGIVDVVG